MEKKRVHIHNDILFLESFYKLFPKTAKKLGIKEGMGAKYLGRGSYGRAYELGGKVFKITGDDTELRTSAYAMTKKLKHTWKIYATGEIPRLVERDGVDYKLDLTHYNLIIGEKLDSLSNKEAKIFDTCIYISRDIFPVETSKSDVLKKYDSYSDWIEAAGVYQDMLDNDRLMSFNLDDFIKKGDWLFAALKELGDAGIEFSDYHAGNIMKKGGKYKIIDLGESKSPAASVGVMESVDISLILKDPRVKNLDKTRLDTLKKRVKEYEEYGAVESDMVDLEKLLTRLSGVDKGKSESEWQRRYRETYSKVKGAYDKAFDVTAAKNKEGVEYTKGAAILRELDRVFGKGVIPSKKFFDLRAKGAKQQSWGALDDWDYLTKYILKTKYKLEDPEVEAEKAARAAGKKVVRAKYVNPFRGMNRKD